MNEQPRRFRAVNRLPQLTKAELAAIRPLIHPSSPGLATLDWTIAELERIISELSAARRPKSA